MHWWSGVQAACVTCLYARCTYTQSISNVRRKYHSSLSWPFGITISHKQTGSSSQELEHSIIKELQEARGSTTAIGAKLSV